MEKLSQTDLMNIAYTLVQEYVDQELWTAYLQTSQ